MGATKRELTPIEKALYIQGNGVRCPLCKSTEMYGDDVPLSVNDDTGEATENCFCGKCGAEFKDTYKLIDTKLIREGDTSNGNNSKSRRSSTQLDS